MLIEYNFVLIIFLFFLCKIFNTYYTDYLIKNNDDIDNNYLILINSLFCFNVSYLLSPKPEKKNTIIPYDKYIVISSLTFLNSQVGLYCLNFITITNKNIIALWRPIPIILLRWYNNEPIYIYQINGLICIVVGSILLNINNITNDTIFGFSLMFITLFSGGLNDKYQDNLLQKYKVNSLILMYNVQIYRIIISLFMMQNYIKFLYFIRKYCFDLCLISLSQSGIQICIFYTLNNYGSYVNKINNNTFIISYSVYELIIRDTHINNLEIFGLIFILYGIVINYINLKKLV